MTEYDKDTFKETRKNTLKHEDNQQDVAIIVLVTCTVDVRKVSPCFVILVFN